MGDKTVAVEAFEGNNLVLIDEGHKGTGSAAGAWMRRRDKLTRDGFAFEYSATFGQAVAGGNNVEAVETEIQATREVYGKSILFDYSYKFFYEDGYGKE